MEPRALLSGDVPFVGVSNELEGSTVAFQSFMMFDYCLIAVMQLYDCVGAASPLRILDNDSAEFISLHSCQ